LSSAAAAHSVSHETIYLTLFVQARGALKRELATHLRTRRIKRWSRAHTSRGRGRGQIVEAVAINDQGRLVRSVSRLG
jgi:hypothetical protein